MKGFEGDGDLQAELGGGYSLLTKSWFGLVGAQGEHLNTALIYGGDFAFAAGVNSRLILAI